MTDKGNFTSRRRSFLRKVGSATALATFGTTGAATADRGSSETTPPERPVNSDPFTLGIASGDPLPTAVVIWTRLAPKPLESDGGMPDHQVPVRWQVATDEQMNQIVKQGTAHARPEHAHSVHVDVTGLEPNTEYYYQFETPPSRNTAVGTTKTAPANGESVDEFTFAFASCQNYPTGYYTAYRDMAEEDLDLIIHLGDYIYEGDRQGTLGRGHEPPCEATTLEEYRIRYAQYKTDPDLQAAHAASPWVVTSDDHEVVNDYADATHPSAPPEEFLKRRADAYQAFWEHLPLRTERIPDGPNLPLYRRFTFGELAEFSILDTRQYRDDIIYGENEEMKDGYYPSSLNPGRTLLGDEQERWLLDGLDESSAQWDVLAQQVIFAAMDSDPLPDKVNYMDYNKTDKWNGYKPNRDRLLDFITERPELDPIVLTGDIHENYVYDIKSDFSDDGSETIGTEFVGTSISSFGDGSGGGIRSDQTAIYEDEDEPYQKFYNDDRGYVHCTVTPDEWKTDFRVVSTVEEPDAPVNTLASFVTEAGDPGAKQVTPRIQFEIPHTYQSDPLDGSLEPSTIVASVENPEGDGAAAVTVENLTLRVTGEPDDWRITANTSTEFDTISDGESVTADWEVVPGSIDGDVTLLVEAMYEIDGQVYKYSDTSVLSAAKLADWRFENDNSDNSSYDNTFSLENGAEYDDEVAIEGEYSVSLDGSDDYVLLSNSGDGFLHESFNERTVSMWIAPDTTKGRQGVYNEGGSVDGLAIRIVDGTLQAGAAINSEVTTIESPFTETDWVHIAIVFENGDLRLHVDGTEVAAGSAPVSGLDDEFTDINEHGADAVIGSSSSDIWEEGVEDSYFAGHVDATTIYSQALSAEQISTLSTTY